MKRILGLLSLLLFFTACDDGDLTVETIDFSAVTPVKCGLNNIIYKLNGNELLALEIPGLSDFEAAFPNDPTLPGTVRTVFLGGANRVIYRSYDGPVGTGNICATIPASTPGVIQEWTATSGRIEIITTANTVTDPVTNATSISSYNHLIVFKNISFNKPSGVQVYETFLFGTYQSLATNLPFAFNPDAVQKCPSANVIFNFSGSESLVLTISPDLYPNTIGTQTGLVSATNEVTYKLFASGLTADYFCAATTPATPAVVEEWNAVDGIANTSGIIEVITTLEAANTYRHTIHLKNMVFQKGNNMFSLGDDYVYGSFVTTN